MPTEVQVLRLGIPHDKTNHEKRIKHAISLLEGSAERRKVFVAGQEMDGLVPVTIASRLDSNRVAVTDMAVVAKCWDSARFEQEINSARAS